MTGKLELEYEGEMKGADTVVHDLIRTAVGKIFDRYFAGDDTKQIEQWFNLGGTVKLDDDQSSRRGTRRPEAYSGALRKACSAWHSSLDDAPKVVSAAEFLLEGLVAHRKLSRSEERVFAANEKPQRKPERAELEFDYDDWQRARRTPRGGYN